MTELVDTHRRDGDAGDVDPGRLLTALTTEHFGLAGARGTTTTESSARTALYLGSVSSSLIALGFVSGDETTFRTFALIVLPTLFALGLLTFLRLVELGVEDVLYGRAINRIRRHYLDLAGDKAYLFLLEAHDDAYGVLRNMGLGRGGLKQLALTFATAIGVVNSAIGATAVGIALRTLGAPVAACAVVGVVLGLGSIAVHVRLQMARQLRAGGLDDVRFPSPEPA